ncbi:GtrA family protein [bacterium]|nr:GtrA family protein [bacterium]MCI0603432.1 GtrA family protein [bacterium]
MNRWFRFILVGALGLILQLSCIAFLRSMGAHYLISTAIAVEAAVLHNFLWHHSWTWKDRQGSFIIRMLSFHLTNGFISIVGNLLLMPVFVELARLPVLAANLSAITLCSILNFLAADRVVFGL